MERGRTLFMAGMRTSLEGGMEYGLVYDGKEPEGDVIAKARPARLKRVKALGRGGVYVGWSNMLIHGENLGVLKALLLRKEKGALKNRDGTPGARLVYIDPPFSTRQAFRAGGKGPVWSDSMTGPRFLESLRKRLILLRELLSRDGSIYVHLDWRKAHYVKVMMDEIFGEHNFLNDIIWSYGGRGAKAVASQFSRNHDIILWYGRSGRHVFNRPVVEKTVLKGSSGYRLDARGRWFKTSPRGDYTDESIRALMGQGRIHTTKTGKIRVKYFLREDGLRLVEDKPVGDVWDDIPDGMHLSSVEKTGYPKQKPEALLRRIVAASSNPGDIVLDAYAGSGTTLAAAEALGRGWIGIDAAPASIETTMERLIRAAGAAAPGPPRIAAFAVYSSSGADAKTPFVQGGSGV
jgi:DNA modification methylase